MALMYPDFTRGAVDERRRVRLLGGGMSENWAGGARFVCDMGVGTVGFREPSGMSDSSTISLDVV
jgi:hypothetical protein